MVVIVTATENETQNTAIFEAFKTRHRKQTTAMAKSTTTTLTEAVATIRK